MIYSIFDVIVAIVVTIVWPLPSGEGTENTNRQGATNAQNIGVNDDPFVHRFSFS